MKLDRKFLTMGIGSLPYINSAKSVELVFKAFDIPFWPQLPKRGFKENMYSQFSQGLPGLVVDEKKRTIHVDSSKDLSEGLAGIYEAHISGDYDLFGITEEFAEGFYLFIKEAKKYKPAYVKGHITGPVSFGLGVADENGRPIIYNDGIKEAFVKLLEIKAIWQIDKLKDAAENIIIFIDEPYLTSFGSSFMNIKREDVISMLDSVIDGIHSKGAKAGIHCCGNTDWSVIAGTKVDIINFDAYLYADNLTLYSKDIERFLKRGGYLAWGIAPTSEAILKETGSTLFKKLSLQIDNLEKRSVDRNLIISNSLLTPSCGMGTLSEDLTEDIVAKLFELAKLSKTLN
ncbi:MAG: methionine synthase [Candidatus Omnitrophota bacterium]|nr:methionine synthase [Candidatus Omnitrophota bacterium]